MGYRVAKEHDVRIGFLAYTSAPNLQQIIWHHVVRPQIMDYPHEQEIKVKMSSGNLWIYGQKLDQLFRHICDQDLALVSIDTDKTGVDGVVIRDIRVIDEDD